ncbi:hypothetical protein [Acanthopleuribacter pedis]|uniref:Uncharacterized protein n=1 Tax=Acanthopleuribacter pedis TaxID=442870 RepID=A0A8J7Q690_9BACT|nr:hypothetical protein [Acanthopleuribacter pedis]MBO1318841.1 hypothetical protein [Acanthopleuribacter pedis]
MNVIVRLILDIFQAIFEKDAEERRRRQQQKPPPVPKKGQGGTRPKSKNRDLDAWIEDLVDDELPETRQPSRPAPPVPAPIMARSDETFDQHSVATAYLFNDVDRHVDAYINEPGHAQAQQQAFQLPGQNALVQLVLAQEILGKPKGLRR